MAAGFISFPGVLAPQSLIVTRTTGVRPDRSILFAQPQPGTPNCSGTAVLQFGFNGVAISMTNVLCDKGTFRISTAGHQQVFVLLDIRWQWSKAFYTQAFNVRQPDGSIESATKFSLQQIAFKLFTKLGITADVSAVSSTYYPEIVFDHHRVDDALDLLLTDAGYIISLNVDNSVTVYVRGVGATLPYTSDVRNVSITLNPPEIPYWLTVCGSRTLVQSKLWMQPVGIELDGTIMPVNSLSYKPAGGWDGTDLEGFSMIADKETKELCKLAIGKWYQVQSQGDRTQNINYGGTNYAPGEIAVDDASQYLPLMPRLLTSYVDPFGYERSDIPYIEGTVYLGDALANPPQGKNSDDVSRIDRREYTLDRENGIVKFKELALRKTPGPVAGTTTWAKIYLTCAYSIHDTTSFVKDRFIRRMNLGGIGEDQYKLDEFERQIVVQYAANSVTPNGIDDNLADLQTDADVFLNQAANQYVVVEGNILFYRAIQPINTDGVTLQVRWDCASPGECPWGTHVSQNFEGLPLLPTSWSRGNQRKARMSSNPITRRNRAHKRAKRKLE
jgi:hypothetical protein